MTSRLSQTVLPASLLAALWMLVAVSTASAHGGGTPKLVQVDSGPYWLYTWTNPEPPRAGRVHVTVALVDPATEQPVLNADVQVIAVDAAGQQMGTVPATHANALVKSYYEADLELATAGRWQIVIAHSDANGAGRTTFDLDVQAAAFNWRPLLAGVVVLAAAIVAWRMWRKPGENVSSAV